MNVSRALRDLGEEIEESMGIRPRHRVLRTVGLATAGVTVVALGVVVGRELRQRYKFTRRTPYDNYAQAGDPRSEYEYECGVGI